MKFLRWFLSPGCVQPMVIGGLLGSGTISIRVVLALFVAFVVDTFWRLWVESDQGGPGRLS